MLLPPADVCHRALASRDTRFDGRLFVGVRTTGIYCRPICPARTAKPENCSFFASAAAAHEAGFRPCLRCRPEAACDTAAWRGTSSTVSRGLALIGEGVLADEAGVPALAARLGVGERHLRRLFERHLGAPPIAVAQTRRILFAKQLLQETGLSMSDVASASGFGSVRRFNDAFDKLFGAPPSSLRTARGTKPALSTVTLRLGYRAPYDWPAMVAHLRPRAVRGVEVVDGDVYARTIELGGHAGTIMISPGRGHLLARIRFPDVRSLLRIVARLRRMFDLDADVAAIGDHLARDRALAPLVAKRPGLRVPGAWDGFELAVRAVLGQQVTVEAARTYVGRLVAETGSALPEDRSGDARLTTLFPTPRRVATAQLSALGVPAARQETVVRLARAVESDDTLLASTARDEEAVARLLALPGIGPWTAEYWALRAIHDTDAFPAGDAALLRAMRARGRPKATSASLSKLAEAWRPWRGYAAQHLWTEDQEARDAS